MIIRSPKSTRPWQHVLEPISGYLVLAKRLYKESNVIVLPGSYLAVENKKINPGKGFVRIAIVHKTEIIEQALTAVNKAYTEA